LFVALAVPGDVKSALREAQSDLRSHLPADAASWPRPENFHLTLRFLGNVQNDCGDALKSALAAVADALPPLNLVAERLGCFPNLRHPHVVWAWVHDAGEGLQELRRRVNTATEPFTAEPAEGEFVGHITLARLRQTRRAEAEQVAAYLHRSVARCFGAWRAETLLLMRSELHPDGSRHTCLAQFPFRDARLRGQVDGAASMSAAD